ncbi:MAG: MlaD family protein [Oceanipulchritudo sp.]
MSKQANFFAIGLFIIIATALGAAAMLIFGSSIVANRTTTLLATFQGSVHGLRDGAKVKAYGVEIGAVREILIHRDSASGETVVPVLFSIKMDELCILLGYESPEAFEREAGQTGFQRGARAMLRPESLVTGLLYIELTTNAVESEGYVLESERFSEYISIPTVRTEMQVMIDSLLGIVREIEQSDFVGLIDETRDAVKDIRTGLRDVDIKRLETNINALLEETRTFVANPVFEDVLDQVSAVLVSLNSISTLLDERTEPALDRFAETLEGLDKVANEARAWLDPTNPLYGEMIEALDQVGDTARSLRQLAETLERNPNIILTGKQQPGTEP